MAATVAGWIAYAAARGITIVDDASSAAALQRGADYIKYHYVARLVAPYDDTLAVIEPATYVAAGRELANPGFFSRSYTPSQQRVLTGVDTIKWTVVGGSRSGYEGFMPTDSLLEAMFDPYVTSSDEENFSFISIGRSVRER